ncbi:hypothetical protein Aph01nite_24830 [Acrocarpospora phusangensis]|uniref:Uncharacterized protein n=1 Tax=Acrocarpospora phusangensis TaxID=1070424 RepID=A0A919Q8W5_9ACTN|nr:hypothetical protein [Acrocarpospora phusangensis]GIH24173.1 hypothetical protein Aph01nite_24830 [Acrocarpospora phusangensis]
MLFPTPRMLISAGVVGVILVGGVAVAQTAAGGRLQEPLQLKEVTRATPAPVETSEEPEPYVVSTHLPGNPAEITEYWTKERLEDAQPMPIPEVSISIKPN